LQWLPDYRPLAWSAAPWLVAGVVAAKAIVAVFIMKALVGSRLASVAAVRKWLLIWAAITALLATAIFVLIPAGTISVWASLAAAMLVVPFNRLAVAPLALNWDRHR
jgi:hypothetical protein